MSTDFPDLPKLSYLLLLFGVLLPGVLGAIATHFIIQSRAGPTEDIERAALFGALAVGSSAALNQIGYLLIVGVLLDCFVTTKVIIPCAMALLPGDLNFWPRVRGGAR